MEREEEREEEEEENLREKRETEGEINEVEEEEEWRREDEETRVAIGGEFEDCGLKLTRASNLYSYSDKWSVDLGAMFGYYDKEKGKWELWFFFGIF